MKKRIFLLLLLLFALFGVVFLIPRLMEQAPSGPSGSPGVPDSGMSDSGVPDSGASAPGASDSGAAEPGYETMEEKTWPYETVSREPDSGESETWETEETEETESEYDPGEPVDREKTAAKLIFASDIHYMSPELTDYGSSFNELIDNGDGKVVRYMPAIWQAFSEEVIAAQPDALILSGDLTMDGERANHEALAERLSDIEAAGIPVLVIPGNHDINNPGASAYIGEEKTPVDTVTSREFREIYRAFGYDEAAACAPDSMSYLYILNDTTWLLMLDTCIYEPENEVDGEIREGTMEWAEQCLRDAYSQGITVIPVGHHNLQELSRVYVKECVLRNHVEALSMFERYLTPVYISGHLHVQRIMKHMSGPGGPDDVYGIWEIVSNSLIIPPCQYGILSLNADGSLSYHTENTDVSSWAARHGEENPDLLDFRTFSDTYIRTVISRQISRTLDDVPEHLRQIMTDFYVNLYRDYYAGRQASYSEKKQELGYQLWNRFMNPSIQFRQVDGMMRDGMAVNNHAEIPNPIRLKRE